MEPTPVAPAPQAVAARPENTGRIAKTIGYYWAFIALGLSSAVLGPTLPGLAELTRSSLSQVSILFATRSLGYMLGSLGGGRLYDRVPGHPLMAGMLLVMAIMLSIIPLSPLLWLLALLMILLGMAEATLDVGGNVLLVWVHREKNAPFMNGLHFFFGVGAFLAPIIIAQAVLISGRLEWAFWSLALLFLPMVAYLLRLQSPVNHEAGEAHPMGPTRPYLVALISFFFFLNVGAEAAFGGWIFTYAKSLGLVDDTMAAYLTSAFWGALMLGRLLTVPLAARIKPQTILLGELTGCLLSPAVILLWPQSPAVVWIGTLAAGLSIASVFPSTISYAERRMAITGSATRWFFAGGALGGMILPWLIGQLFERVGPQATMWVLLVDLALAMVVYFVLAGIRGRGEN